MKNQLLILMLVLFCVSAFGQKIPKNVESRLNSIRSAVEITKKEERKIIISIEKFLCASKEIEQAKREHIGLEKRENSKRYLSEILIILDDERYQKWRYEVKRKNKA